MLTPPSNTTHSPGGASPLTLAHLASINLRSSWSKQLDASSEQLTMQSATVRRSLSNQVTPALATTTVSSFLRLRQMQNSYRHLEIVSKRYIAIVRR